MRKVFKQFRETWAGRATAIVLIGLLAWVLRLWRLTLRVTVVDPNDFLHAPPVDGAVAAFWHNRLVFMGTFFPRRLRRLAVAMTSPSRDGQYAAMLVSKFVARVVRGSSSRGGREAVVQLKRELDRGRFVCLAVDGPRGPRYQVQPGVGLLARRCGVPVVPISINAPHRWQLKSWDGLQFPRPFSRVTLWIGARIEIDSACDLRTEACQKVQDALLDITDDCRQ